MRKILLILLLCFVAVSFAQNERKLDSLYTIWKDDSKVDSTRVKAFYNYIYDGYLFSKPDSAFILGQELLDFSKKNRYPKGQVLGLNLHGIRYSIAQDYERAEEVFLRSIEVLNQIGDDRNIASTYNNLGNLSNLRTEYVEAIKYYKNSLKASEELKDNKLISASLNNIGSVYRKLGNYSRAISYFERGLSISESENDSISMVASYSNVGNIYLSISDNDNALKYYKKALEISQNLKNFSAVASINGNIGLIHNRLGQYEFALASENNRLKFYEETGDKIGLTSTLTAIGNIYSNLDSLDQAKKSYEKSLQISTQYSLKTEQSLAIYNLGVVHFKLRRYNESIRKCLLSYTFFKDQKDLSFQKEACKCLYDSYKAKGDTQKALGYHEEMMALNDSLKPIETAKKLQKMEFEKQVLADSLLQVEKELIVEIAHQKEKNKLTWGWGGSLSAVSILAFLVFRNVKQKQRKAEEERQKQIEEKEKILKDLELQTIDAMIAGQEKERQRLAADLHDSVGATLAAAKLQFNHLIKDEIDNKIREKLIKKTSTLLEDAYVEIRSMAHLKNAGVIAKNGLLPAVKNLTDNASGINGLSFEIQSFGLEQRLDNSLEISIFRIIQELVTNIIKHANATKGIVYLTNHDSNLNVMIEDNGKGFNPKQIKTNKSGMGISSIDKRVGHLEGKLSIESELNKGTTVIIDIPL